MPDCGAMLWEILSALWTLIRFVSCFRNVGILSPRVDILESGSFVEWMELKGKSGGQHKVPRLMSKEQADELLEISSKRKKTGKT